jgi:hypothetical protein
VARFGARLGVLAAVAVFGPFELEHLDFAPLEINVLPPQAERFGLAQSEGQRH